MTEKEYSMVSDLATIRAAKNAMTGLVPECLCDAVKEDEWKLVMQTLIEWEDRLNKEIGELDE